MTINITTENDTVTGVLDGRLDTAAAAQFAQDMKPLYDNADKHIMLDCEKLSFISSSGLRLLLSLRKATIEGGGDVTILNVPPEVKQVFTITGFYSLFKFQ
ncbi:MAG: STAS domain-containing protein [Bacteroidaceae bacterium]|nr:STAS domain-containing protein [Bacteroidaceae bacterium]